MATIVESLRRSRFLRGFATALVAVMLCDAQDRSEQRMEFEVASVRPAIFPKDFYAAGFRAGAATNPCTQGSLSISGTLVRLTTVGICDIIRIAYNLKPYQVIGVPDQLGLSGENKTASAAPGVPARFAIADEPKQPIFFYDVEARAPGVAPPNDREVQTMLRALLTDRFRLQAHWDRRELSYYALITNPNGPKLKPAADTCKPKLNADGRIFCGQTMDQLAMYLNADADRPVLNMTGFSGRFDYEIERHAAGDFDSLAASVQEHLKLKLEARKGPVEVLKVDRVERPSSN